MGMIIPPVPRQNPVLEVAAEKSSALKALIAKIQYHWDNWFQGLANALNLTGQQVASVALTAQHATVTAASFTTATLSAGLYRVTYYARITRAATVSSSLTVAFNWMDGGVACSFTEAAMTGNTTSTTQGDVIPFQIDAASSVTYTLTYATNGATGMLFAFTASLEALP